MRMQSHATPVCATSEDKTRLNDLRYWKSLDDRKGESKIRLLPRQPRSSKRVPSTTLPPLWRSCVARRRLYLAVSSSLPIRFEDLGKRCGYAGQ